MSVDLDLDVGRMLQSVARRLFGTGVAVAAQDPRRPAAGLLPAERDAVAGASPVRVRVFAAGRSAARAAMSEIGVYGQPVFLGDAGAPVWPGNLVGSISHAEDACLAAVGRGDQIQSIGLNVGMAGYLSPEQRSMVLTRNEQDRLDGTPRTRGPVMERVILSAKHCAFKCQFPLTGVMLGYHDLEIRLDPATKTFHAHTPGRQRDSDPANRMTGRYAVLMGHVLTTMSLRRW